MRRIVLAALAAALTAPLAAQDAGPDGADRDRSLENFVAAQQALIRRLERRIVELEQRLERVEQRDERAVRAESASTDAAAAEAPAGAGGLPELTERERREQEQLVRAAFQRTLIDRGGLLLPTGTVDVQPSLSYLHSSAENIVIDGFTILPVLVVGDIVSERRQRDLSQVSTTLRFGLPWESQLELRVPYSYQRRRSVSADNAEQRQSTAGLGDVEIGISRQVLRSSGLKPDLLVSLRWKTRTGDGPFDVAADELALGAGYDSLNLALTGVKVVDPIVYFGTLSYSKNFARDEEVGRYDPGDSVGLSLGMAVALNLNGSLSFSYDQQFTRRTRVDGLGVPGSYLTTGMFSVGGSFALNDSLTADLSLGIGITEDSPDLQIGASFPFRLRR